VEDSTRRNGAIHLLAPLTCLLLAILLTLDALSVPGLAKPAELKGESGFMVIIVGDEIHPLFSC
jgi:hypothetical protein